MIRAGSNQHSGRGLNDGWNVPELPEDTDKWEESEREKIRGREGWVGKVGAADSLLFQAGAWRIGGCWAPDMGVDRAAFQICLFLL